MTKMKTKLLAAAASAIALAFAGTASAATLLYNLNVYDATSGITGASLGTVSVTGQGTSTLLFDVSLNPNVYFQLPGNSKWHDSFWFNLDKTSNATTTPFAGSVTVDITSPDGPASGTGDFGTGGLFQAVTTSSTLGQGWSSGHYGLQDRDNVGAADYYTGHLTFTLTADDASLLSLDGSTHNGATVFGGADLRQCLNGACNTGPVGFSLASAAPEPGSWALMIMGFGAVGATFRRRRSVLALAR
jgi:hypothetical protein